MKTILVCDDSKFTRNRIIDIIYEHEYTIVEAENGQEALEIIENKKPDLVILDLLMPVLTGQEVLEKLQQKENKTPVIILSADIQETTRKKCEDLGAFAFFNKPPERKSIKQVIEKAFSLKN